MISYNIVWKLKKRMKNQSNIKLPKCENDEDTTSFS